MRKTLVIYFVICSCIPFSVYGQPNSPQQTASYRKAKDSLLTDLTKRKSNLNYQADTGYIKALVVLGNVMFSLNNIDTTLILSRQSLVLAEKINEYRGIFYSLINLSRCNNRKPDTALAYLSQASKVIEKMNVPKHQAEAFNSMGNEYIKFPDVSDQRTEYFLKALKIYENIGSKKDIVYALINLSTGNRFRRNTANWKEKWDLALDYAFQALKLGETTGDKKLILNCLSHIANVYSSLPDWDKVIEYNTREIKLMSSIDDKPGMIREYIKNGEIYLGGGSIPYALENFLNALKIAESMKDTGQIRSVLMQIAAVYMQQGKYAEGRNYFLKANTLMVANDDANAIKGQKASGMVNVARTYYEEKRYPEALEIFFNALKLFEEMGPRVRGIAVCNYNIADIYRAQGKYKEALKYSLKARDRFIEDPSSSLQYYGNLGAVYLGLEQYDSALLYANKFYEWAKRVKNKNDLRDANELLSKIYEATGDGMKGLYHQKQFKLLADSIFNQETEKKTAYLSADYEFSKKEDSLKYEQQLTNEQLQKQVLLTEQQEQEIILKNQEAIIATKEKDLKQVELLKEKAEKQDKEKQLVLTEKEKSLKESELKLSETNLKKQKIIRNVSIAGLAGLMFFSIVVFRQRNRVRKEKKRSDELLLNILPAETAEELKRTGKTSAKDFNEVTILFTDFKNFTAMSEKLNAQELVNEINYCYSAFDKIITKHGIEKIKTIGDSYMCAGGLPVENKTNAADTVQAALEIRDFIHREKVKREADGKTYLDIRIGCNTGSVVAGIVGIKKFAYDIWGDAVNIASRMESSGEPGKVNISGSTYELVKDKFACIYRGKIEAKNKGEVDMYFVEDATQ